MPAHVVAVAGAMPGYPTAACAAPAYPAASVRRHFAPPLRPLRPLHPHPLHALRTPSARPLHAPCTPPARPLHAPCTPSAPAAPLQSLRLRNRCTCPPLLTRISPASRLYVCTAGHFSAPPRPAPSTLCILCTPCTLCTPYTLCSLRTSAPPHLRASAPLRLCASAPLHPCAPLRLCTPAPLHPMRASAGLPERDRCAWRVRRRGDRHSGADGD